MMTEKNFESIEFPASWRHVLTDPIIDLAQRPSKAFRAQLLHLVARVVGGQTTASQRNNIEQCSEIIELLHLGSLMVDDVQDESTERRGDAAAHIKFGIPRALASGTWLYFYAQRQVIEQLELNDSQRARLMHELVLTMEAAHRGQALDLSCKAHELEPSEVYEIQNFVALHKTGCLIELAVTMACICCQAPSDVEMHLRIFAREFGIALQSLDDIGNVQSQNAKRHEDLWHLKPSWVWAKAAMVLDTDTYRDFKAAAIARDALAIDKILRDHHVLERAKNLAIRRLNEAVIKLEQELENTQASVTDVRTLGEKLQHAYA